MALAKQHFFFPFFLFANGRYIVLGPVYASYDLSPLHRQNYLIKMAAWVSGEAGEILSGGHSLHSERRGSSCLSVAGGRGVEPQSQSIAGAEHPLGRASLLLLSTAAAGCK